MSYRMVSVFTWEMVRNANSWTSSQTHWTRNSGTGPRNLCFDKLLSCCYACILGTIAVENLFRSRIPGSKGIWLLYFIRLWLLNSVATCTCWALEMQLEWMRNYIFNLILILNTETWCSYWKNFKYVWNNFGLWIYIFNCKFYET